LVSFVYFINVHVCYFSTYLHLLLLVTLVNN
jgi:hypothetical protein